MTRSDFECPHCEREVDLNSEPDYLVDMKHNRFNYECDCGASFDVSVDWDPVCYVAEDTLKRPTVEAVQ